MYNSLKIHKTRVVTCLTRRSTRLYTYTLPTLVASLPRKPDLTEVEIAARYKSRRRQDDVRRAQHDWKAPLVHLEFSRLEALMTRLALQMGRSTSLEGLQVIQRCNKWYYRIFAGLFTGVVGVGATEDMEQRIFRDLIRLMSKPRVGITGPDAYVMDDESRRARKYNVALPFRMEYEVVEHGSGIFLSYKALAALAAPLHDYKDIPIQSYIFYDALCWAIVHQHSRDPRILKGTGRHRRDVRLLKDRTQGNKCIARGRAWTESEDHILRMLLNSEVRYQYAVDRKRRRREARDSKLPWDEKKERELHDAQHWARVTSSFPERPKSSIRARIRHLNKGTKRRFLEDGFIPHVKVAEYQHLMLGVRNVLPRYRPRLNGPYAPGIPTVQDPTVITWQPEEDRAVIELFKKPLEPAAFHKQVIEQFHGSRPDELVLERAHALRQQGVLHTQLPPLTRRRGRPDRAEHATRTQPTAIPNVVRARTEPASPEGPST